MSIRLKVVGCLIYLPVQALAEVTFQKHVIDSQFKAEACTAIDIDRDGKLEIVAGDSWYQAPDWRPHKFREMAMIGGYADVRCDYPVDVNHDGWMDIVTARRVSSMEWLENPKGKEGIWSVHKIGDSPVTEPIWFADVDGDGQGDFIAPIGEKGKSIAYWTRESDPLLLWRMVTIGPRDPDPHGIGTGDIDRDGRVDIITRTGWYQPPTDLKRPWTWHELDRGLSHQPMVYDFDGDGDQDIAAGAPHDYGLWWWEQAQPGKDGAS